VSPCFALNFIGCAACAERAKTRDDACARRTLRADSSSRAGTTTPMILGEAGGGRKQVDSGQSAREARAWPALAKPWSVPTIRSTHGA
jgi:hypothetical protein